MLFLSNIPNSPPLLTKQILLPAKFLSPFVDLAVWGEIPLVGPGREAGGRAQVGTVRQVLRPLDWIQRAARAISLHMLQLVVLELDQGVQGGRLALPAFAFCVEREVLAGYLVRIYVVLFAEILKQNIFVEQIILLSNFTNVLWYRSSKKQVLLVVTGIALNSLPPCRTCLKKIRYNRSTTFSYVPFSVLKIT
jgi:hypothetical protein